MSELEKRELEENELVKVTGGGGLHFGIEKPHYIVYECKICGGLKNVSLDDYNFINSVQIAGGLCCGKYREIKYHCPQCGSELVTYFNGTFLCSKCQKATNSN